MEKLYFEWLCDKVCCARNKQKYSKLLTRLYYTEFAAQIPMDENRCSDGLNLRYIFSQEMNIAEDMSDIPINGCSILELMIALAVRCENDFMSDLEEGDRTDQWFWRMIFSLGLEAQHDINYNDSIVENILLTFIFHQYQPDGKGGLFYIENSKMDLRGLEIWDQLNQWILSIMF